jgi:carbon-monoxide dehydrogenase medium subunit
VKPAPFDYLAPTTVEETLALLREHGEDAKVLAGGQSLVPMLNFRLARPAVLLDINRVAGLDGLEVRDGELRIGAMTRQRAVETRLPVTSSTDGAWGVLRKAAGYIGHSQIRARGTVGGSLAHADPAAELPAAVSALGATLLVQSAGGSREVAPEDFFEGFFTTSLSDEELLTGIRVPSWPTQTRSSFQEVSRRRGDFAIVAVAAVVALSEGLVTRAGVALAGAASGTLQASSVIDGLVGQAPDTRTIREMAGDFAADLDPPADNHGPVEYRRHLARRLLERALIEATAPPDAAVAA